MAKSIIDEQFAEWLVPVTVDLGSEQYGQWRRAVTAITASLELQQSLHLVRAAHAVLEETARGWLVQTIQEHDATFTRAGNDALLHTLAAAAVIEALVTAGHPKRALLALLVKSARFSGLKPTTPDATTAADAAILELTRATRERVVAMQPPLHDLLGDLPEVGSDEEPNVPTLESLASVLAAHDTVLRQVADRVDGADAQLLEVIQLQDEELNALWWSYGARSTTLDKPWNEVAPVERATLVAPELRSVLRRSPSPPSTTALMARALGDDAHTRMAVTEIVEAIGDSSIDLSRLPQQDGLFPLAACVNQIRAMGHADDTWKTVVQRTVGFESDQEVTLLAAAQQFLRELDLCELV